MPTDPMFYLNGMGFPTVYGILPGENSVNIPLGSGNPWQDIWANVLGLPSGLNCPQVGGLSDFLCGGISPIMDADKAANNIPNIAYAGQSWSDCYNSFHDSAAGRATEFFSALSWFPVDKNWKSNIKDTATFGLAKASTVGVVSHFGRGLWQLGAKGIEYAATGIFATASAIDSTVFVGCGGAALDTLNAPPSRVQFP
jgi:hypothetical protein